MNFEDIYNRHFRDVFLYIRSLSAAEDVAEEITQETFYKALKSIDRYDGSQDIRAWLFTIARNTYYTYCKRRNIYIDNQVLDAMETDDLSLADTLINEDSAFLIHQFLHRMNDPYKEVFTLRIFGELSFEKIGLLFGKSSGWARITFYRAKKQIMEYMEALNDGKNQL